MSKKELQQLNQRIQILAEEIQKGNLDSVTESRVQEIQDLTEIVKEILFKPPNPNTKTARMERMRKEYSVSARQILYLAEDKEYKASFIDELTDEQWDVLFKEVDGLYQEGLLESYLHHLEIKWHYDGVEDPPLVVRPKPSIRMK